MNKLVDKLGRIHDYMRISVTDRCNLRCVYCMPEEGMEFEPSDRILSYEEIEAVVKAVAKMGVRKLRLTGGEPLVRREIEKLIAMLSAIPGIEDIALTTNAIFLESKAEKLREAGLTHGSIKPCLYWNDEWNVRPLAGDEGAIQQLILRALDAKPEMALSRQSQSHTPTMRRMSQIGG
jgi:molybdenum cofactor biosynthesis enzyme MoaA